VINEGEAEGVILGGNLCTFNLLQGTKFMPDLSQSILFLEEDEYATPQSVDRDLQSLIHQPGFEKVRGIVFGRFMRICNIPPSLVAKIVKTKKELEHIPVLANADFGHTDPKITFPIGGTVTITSYKDKSTITITSH